MLFFTCGKILTGWSTVVKTLKFKLVYLFLAPVKASSFKLSMMLISIDLCIHSFCPGIVMADGPDITIMADWAFKTNFLPYSPIVFLCCGYFYFLLVYHDPFSRSKLCEEGQTASGVSA